MGRFSARELRFAAVISLTHFTQHFLMRLLPPLIPILAVVLEYPLWQLGLLVSLYSFGGGLVQAPLGHLADRYDRLYILPTGIALGGTCYVLFSAAPLFRGVVPGVSAMGHTFDGGFVVMCVAMLGVGLGAAVVHPASYPLISANVGDAQKGAVLGVFGSSSKVGDAAAPAAVGVLILAFVWTQVVFILGLGCLVLAVALFLAFRGDEFVTAPVPYAAGAPDADDPPETVWSKDNRTYLYPMAVIYIFFITKMFSGNGLTTFLPVFVVGVYAYSFQVLGVVFGPESVANFYFSTLLLAAAGSQLVFGGMTDRFDPRWVIIGSLGMATLGLLLLAIADLSPVLLLLVLVIAGAGLWGNNPARDALISEISPPEREGRTFGYLWSAVQLTRSALPVLIGFFIEAVGLRVAFSVLAVGTTMSLIAVSLLFTERVYLPTTDPPGESIEHPD